MVMQAPRSEARLRILCVHDFWRFRFHFATQFAHVILQLPTRGFEGVTHRDVDVFMPKRGFSMLALLGTILKAVVEAGFVPHDDRPGRNSQLNGDVIQDTPFMVAMWSIDKHAATRHAGKEGFEFLRFLANAD